MALTDNLTHYWKFDSNSNDSVGSSNGSDVNTPTYTTGKISNALTCASASSQYVSMPNGIFPWGTNTYTVNMWVNFTSTSGNMSLTMTARTGQGLMFYYAGGVLTHSKPNTSDLNYTWSASTGTWYMLTFVGDGSGMRTYLNGNATPVATNANTSNITAPSTDTIEFGAYRSGGTIQSGWYLDGKLDEVGVWSRALSTTEISELYNSGSGLSYPFSATTTNHNNFLLLGVG